MTTKLAAPEAETGRTRLDKWLWAARFYKTRNLAAEEIARGRVQVNGQPTKPSRDVRPGDRITLRLGQVQREVLVRQLGTVRGPAPVAQTLYEETAESVAFRQRAAEQLRQGIEPALAYTQGRPTKRDRRELTRTQAAWQRWSVSIDDR
jgi:ribosome-associated heat shock protein Hsp15